MTPLRIEPVAVVAQSLACATGVGLATVAAGQSHVPGWMGWPLNL